MKEVPAADAVSDEQLRSALEFAAVTAAAARRVEPGGPLPPADLRRLARAQRPFSKRTLTQVRQALEHADEFRAHVGAKATEAVVGPVGVAWLVRPEGWESQLRDAAQPDRQVTPVSRRLHKQRDAAERARDRAATELSAHRAEQARLQGLVEELTSERDALRAQLDKAEAASRAATDAARAATGKAKAARGDERAARQAAADTRLRLAEAERVRTLALEDRTAAVQEADAARAAARAAADSARPKTAERVAKSIRSPLPIPGGLLEDDVKVAEHLVTAVGVLLVVDGYNVAKLGWPGLDLADQRDRMLDRLEAMIARTGVRTLVVFDGAEAVDLGVATNVRRTFTVEFSPPGVIADDVIVDRVAMVPSNRPVVVATNDRELCDRVRRMGANRLTSEQLLAVACR